MTMLNSTAGGPEDTERLKQKLLALRLEKTTPVMNRFSFKKAKQLLRHVPDNFSDLLIEERRTG